MLEELLIKLSQTVKQIKYDNRTQINNSSYTQENRHKPHNGKKEDKTLKDKLTNNKCKILVKKI